MANLIEIKVNINSVNEVSFLKLLKEIENIGKEMHWSIFCLDSAGDLGKNNSLNKFEKLVNKSPNGIYLDWEKLYQLSNKFYQVIEMVLVGSKNIHSIKRYETDKELFLNYEIVIEMIDGELWRIYSKNKILIQHLHATFKDSRCATELLN